MNSVETSPEDTKHQTKTLMKPAAAKKVSNAIKQPQAKNLAGKNFAKATKSSNAKSLMQPGTKMSRVKVGFALSQIKILRSKMLLHFGSFVAISRFRTS